MLMLRLLHTPLRAFLMMLLLLLPKPLKILQEPVGLASRELVVDSLLVLVHLVQASVSGKLVVAPLRRSPANLK